MSRVLVDDHHKRMTRVTAGVAGLRTRTASLALKAEYRSNFEAINRYWLRLHMSGKFSSGTLNHKQTL